MYVAYFLFSLVSAQLDSPFETLHIWKNSTGALNLAASLKEDESFDLRVAYDHRTGKLKVLPLLFETTSSCKEESKGGYNYTSSGTYLTNIENNLGSIFVINLKKDTERFQFMKKQLDHFDLFFTRFEALDGLAIENAFKGMHRNTIYPFQQKKPSVIACWQSHLQVYFKIFEEKWYKDDRPTLILEDDVALDRDLRNFLSKDFKEIPEDWEMLFLGYDLPENIQNVENKPFITVNHFYGAHAYIVRNWRVAEKLLKLSNRQNVQIADLIYLQEMKEGRLKVYLTKKIYAAQMNTFFKSNLEGPYFRPQLSKIDNFIKGVTDILDL